MFVELLKGDIVIGWLKVLPDPTSARMYLTVVLGKVYRREYLHLSVGEYEGMPTKPNFEVQGTTKSEGY